MSSFANTSHELVSSSGTDGKTIGRERKQLAMWFGKVHP
jgi:hypothetical protein